MECHPVHQNVVGLIPRKGINLDFGLMIEIRPTVTTNADLEDLHLSYQGSNLSFLVDTSQVVCSPEDTGSHLGNTNERDAQE